MINVDNMTIHYLSINFSHRFARSGEPTPKSYLSVEGKAVGIDFSTHFTYEKARKRIKPVLKFHNSFFFGEGANSPKILSEQEYAEHQSRMVDLARAIKAEVVKRLKADLLTQVQAIEFPV